MLARAFVIIGGTIVLALLVALVAPLFVDWTGYRADFERQASAVLGRPVTVKGEASARLIPFPSVTFTDVEVGQGPDGAPAMTVESFSMDAELAPFLSGEILIFDMRLDKPRVTVAVDADGAVDWAARPATMLDPAHVALEKVTVADGEILLRHGPGGRDHAIREIDAVLSAKSLLGPFHAAGTARFDATEGAFALSTGKPDEEGLRVLLRLQPKFAGYALEADGSATLKDGRFVWSGAFALDQTAPTALRGGDGESVAGPAARIADGWRARGKFTADAARIAAEGFRFETGPAAAPYVADGDISIDLGPSPRFALHLDGHQVTLDPAANGPGRPLSDRLAELAEALADAPRPPMAGTVSAAIPAIVMGDTTLREVVFRGEAKAEGWTIDKISAELPGRTTVEGSGFLAGGLTPSFSGDLLAAIAQPSGFAAWLGETVDDAIRRLPAAGVSARVTLNRERQDFKDLEVRLGTAAFRGEASRTAPEGGAPAISVDLDGGALDLAGLSALAAVLGGETGLDRLSGAALDIRLKAGPVDAGGLVAERVDTALRLRDGRLEVDRLLVDGLAGAHVSATATLSDWRKTPTGTVDGAVTGGDLAPLVEALAARFPQRPLFAHLASRTAAWPGLLDDARMDFVATLAGEGEGDRQAITAHGAAGGTAFTLSAAGTFTDGRIDRMRATSLAFEGENPDAGALMALAGLPALPLGQAPAGRLVVDASGKPAEGLSLELALEAGDDALRFAGHRDDAGRIDGDLTLKAGDIGPWLMTAGVAMPGLAEGFPVDLTSRATLEGGALALPTLAGAFGEGKIAGDLVWRVKDGRPDASGRLSLDWIDATLALRALYGEAALSTETAGWSPSPLVERPALPFTGDLSVATQALSLGGETPIDGASMQLAIRPESIAIADFAGAWSGARLTGRAELRNASGEGALSVQGAAENLDLARAFAVPGLGGKGDLSLAVNGSGRSAEAMAASLAGEGALRLEHLVIAGVDAWAFDAIFEAAEAEGAEITPEAAEALVRRLALDRETTFGPSEATLSIAAGKLRAENLAFAHTAAAMNADLRLDLAAMTVDATARLAYFPGDAGVVGAEPEIGFALAGPLAAPGASVDAQPFGRFLVQAALEREQERIDALQAALAEKQRLRREVRQLAWLDAERSRLKTEEDARKAAEDAALKAREAEAAAIAKAAAEAEAKAEAEAAEEANTPTPGSEPPKPTTPAKPAATKAATNAAPTGETAEPPPADVFPDAPKPKPKFGKLLDFLKPKAP